MLIGFSWRSWLALLNPNTTSGRRRIVALIVIGIALVVMVTWVLAIHAILEDPRYGGLTIDTDFSVFWTAARMALDGRWIEPFDPNILNPARMLPPDYPAAEMYWFYPPAFHILISPLGYLSFTSAWLVFMAVSVVALGLALRRTASGIVGAYTYMICAPVSLTVLLLGQNSLLIVALLLAALEAMRREQHVLAGLAFAVMTIKPQLGLAIPFALMAAGYWRAILWASVFTAIMVAVTLIFPGPDYWAAFFHGLLSNSERMQSGNIESIMISGYGILVTAGMAEPLSMRIQAVFSVIVAASVTWLWLQRQASFDIKAAGLCIAILLMTPYAIYYELVFGVAAGLFLARDGLLGSRPGAILITVLWFLSIPGQVFRDHVHQIYVFPVLVLVFIVCLVRAARPRPTTELPT